MIPQLSQIPFLKGADPDALARAQADSEWFCLPAGAPLFRAGEDSASVCFLVSGLLGAFYPAERVEDAALMGYIRPGEPVGEMAMIAEEPHSADVFAMRDSEILRLPRSLFDTLAQAHPPLLMSLAKLMLSRARMKPRANPRAEPKVIALISTSPTIDLKLRARLLQAELASMGAKAAVVGEEGGSKVAAWFDAMERDNDVVLLYSPLGDTTWFRTCMRQADRVWLLARADAAPSIPLFPEEEASPVQRFRLVDVVLLAQGLDRKAAPTEIWRSAAQAARVFHWRGQEGPDCQRLARVLAGRSLGLVLSGGGARAYAHIGVIRALREAGVAIDLIGGTSMGAIVAACYAMGWDDEEIEVRIRRAFVESDPLGDYTLPVVALTRGRRVEDRLLEHFGDALIEDLKVPFYCCSTEVCEGRVQVHDSGVLRHALRATISLPGILPPVVDPARGVLVDGAVLKNLPIDVMAERHRGRIIGVDVARRSGLNTDDFVDPPSFFGWVAAHGFSNPPPIAGLLMRTATLAVDPWDARKHADLMIVPDMPHIDLRDWKEFDEAVAAGYQATVAALSAGGDVLQATGFGGVAASAGGDEGRQTTPTAAE